MVKKLIGRFLQDDLLLEVSCSHMLCQFVSGLLPRLCTVVDVPALLHITQQLEVHLRAGTVELSNFALDCAALTKSASVSNGPFTVASASIRRLRINIAYSNLLSESLTVQVEGVRIEVVPKDTSSEVHNSAASVTSKQAAVTPGACVVPWQQLCAELLLMLLLCLLLVVLLCTPLTCVPPTTEL